MLPLILAPIIASVVKLAEKKMVGGSTGSDKKAWAEEMLLDMWDILAGIPALGKIFKVIAPARETVAALASREIQKAVDRLKKKGKL